MQTKAFIGNSNRFSLYFVSSVRSSYSDGGLLYVDPRQPVFEILSISAKIFSFLLGIEYRLIKIKIKC